MGICCRNHHLSCFQKKDASVTTQQRALGIIGLEIGLPPREFPPPQPESVFNPATFDFPIIIETAAGALEERVIPGDASLEPAYIAAARRLVERGAVAITRDCGFSIWCQAALATSVKLPVAMSSLLLAPTLLRQLPAGAKLAVWPQTQDTAAKSCWAWIHPQGQE